MSEEEWIADNAKQAAEALCRPEVAEELYDLLGGGPDPIGGARTLNKR